jgi:hypothetical protein
VFFSFCAYSRKKKYIFRVFGYKEEKKKKREREREKAIIDDRK